MSATPPGAQWHDQERATAGDIADRIVDLDDRRLIDWDRTRALQRPPLWLAAALIAVIGFSAGWCVRPQTVGQVAPPVAAAPAAAVNVTPTLYAPSQAATGTPRPTSSPSPTPATPTFGSGALDLFAVAVLLGVWMRLLTTRAFRFEAALVPSLILAFVSWVVIVQLIVIVVNTPLLLVAFLVGLLLVGLSGPRGFPTRIAQPSLLRRPRQW